MWHDLQSFRPRILLVEISTQGPSMPVPQRGESYPAQAGLGEIVKLGSAKGYTLVATTYCNALFIENTCLTDTLEQDRQLFPDSRRSTASWGLRRIR